MEAPLPSPRFLYDHLYDASASPWMSKTRAWLEDQGLWGTRGVPSQSTKEWVWAQQEAQRLDSERRARERAAERAYWEATARSIDKQAEEWMTRAEASRQAALRETEKTRLIQEEVRRVRERSEVREAERRKAREEARIASEAESRAKAQMTRGYATKRLVDAWSAYENRWSSLLSSPKEQLTFRTVPWPLICPPSSPSSISNTNIAFFLLSRLHSGGKSPKERIREAMQRWHNDKFEPRILPRVVESDQDAVKEGVGIVVRCLNDLLAHQSSSR